MVQQISWLQPHKLLIALLVVFVERRAAPYLSAILLLFTSALLCSRVRGVLNMDSEVQQHHDAVATLFLFALVALPIQLFYHYPRWREQRRIERELRGCP
jgi:hypothetical protein